MDVKNMFRNVPKMDLEWQIVLDAEKCAKSGESVSKDEKMQKAWKLVCQKKKEYKKLCQKIRKLLKGKEIKESVCQGLRKYDKVCLNMRKY